ncbi:DUF3332 domain-containing protein [bacterium]|nr:MAG: DUF3332 domain-containing protein [bacterium]
MNLSYFKKPVLALVITSMGLVATNCYGPFRLTKKLYDWNGTVGDKYINAILFVALNIVPVYQIVIAVDAIALNSIEFWTGSNPMAMKDGESESKMLTENGKTYQITAKKNTFEIETITGENAGSKTTLNFNPETTTWSMSNGSTSIDLARLVTNGDQVMVEKYLPTGTELEVLD